jgi:hypothetical protein
MSTEKEQNLKGSFVNPGATQGDDFLAPLRQPSQWDGFNLDSIRARRPREHATTSPDHKKPRHNDGEAGGYDALAGGGGLPSLLQCGKASPATTSVLPSSSGSRGKGWRLRWRRCWGTCALLFTIWWIRRAVPQPRLPHAHDEMPPSLSPRTCAPLSKFKKQPKPSSFSAACATTPTVKQAGGMALTPPRPNQEVVSAPPPKVCGEVILARTDAQAYVARNFSCVSTVLCSPGRSWSGL